MENLDKYILDLVLKHKWFDMIAQGLKDWEYRKKTDYWRRRLTTPIYDVDGHYSDFYFKPYTHVRFHRGYTNIILLVELESISSGFGDPKLGAPENEEVYCLKLKLNNL